MRKKHDYVSLAYPPKEYYPLPKALRELLQIKETEEEINNYFEQIEFCKELNICMECGQGVVFNSDNREEHIKEYNISALCKHCQEKIFGM